MELRMRPWNRNYVGTHFGGSLFAMTDPFWMILVKERLGRDYIVWDKAAQIEFVKPGKGTVAAEFHLNQATLDSLRERAADGGKVLHWFDTAIVVARVRKQVYLRRKRGHADAPAGDA